MLKVSLYLFHDRVSGPTFHLGYGERRKIPAKDRRNLLVKYLFEFFD